MKFIIEEKEYNATKLTIQQLTKDVGDKVKEESMQNAIKMGSLMTNPKDKSQFLRDAYLSLPSGPNLMEAIQDFLQSIDGYAWIVETCTGETVVLTETNIEYYIPIVEFAFGIENHSDAEVDKETSPLEI